MSTELKRRVDNILLVEERNPDGQTSRIVQRIRAGADLFEKKNTDYSGSWRVAGLILYLILGEIRLDSPFKQTAYGVYTRMLDKIIRSAHLIFKAEKRLVRDEKPSRSLEDLGVYAHMLADEVATQAEVKTEQD